MAATTLNAKGEKVGNYSAGIAVQKTFIHILCVFLSILSILPFWIMIVNATRSSAEIQNSLTLIPSDQFAHNLEILLKNSQGSFDIFKSMLNSLIISTSSTVLGLYSSCLAAYALVVYRFKLRSAMYTFIVAIMMIPTQVSTVGFINLMYSFNMIDTFWPLILPAIAAPATVFFMRQYIQGALPLEIVEASRIDGCTEFGTFNKIALPIMLAAVATQGIFAFVTSWNNMYMPSLIINSIDKKTLPIVVQNLSSNRYQTEYGVVYCGLTLTVLPMLIVYIFLSKYIIEGVALGSVKE